MELPQDLKHYRPSEDSFQILDPDQALFIFIVGLIAGVVFFGGAR